MSVIAANCPELRIDVVDIDLERIKRWNSNELSRLPVFEPGLAAIVKKCRGKNLFFSNKVEECISNADMTGCSLQVLDSGPCQYFSEK